MFALGSLCKNSAILLTFVPWKRRHPPQTVTLSHYYDIFLIEFISLSCIKQEKPKDKAVQLLCDSRVKS